MLFFLEKSPVYLELTKKVFLSFNDVLSIFCILQLPERNQAFKRSYKRSYALLCTESTEHGIGPGPVVPLSGLLLSLSIVVFFISLFFIVVAIYRCFCSVFSLFRSV